MVDRGLLSVKLAELADRIARVSSRCPATVDELRESRDALDLVSFNLMLAVHGGTGRSSPRSMGRAGFIFSRAGRARWR